MIRPLSRRAVLRGALGVSIPLPFLEIMRPARARAAVSPKRFVVFFTHGGTVQPLWRPTGAETSFKLPPILAPLERHRDDIVVLQGLAMRTWAKGPGLEHFKGPGHFLTCRALLDGNFRTSATDETVGWASGISLDQEVARHTHFGGSTPFRSIELGARVTASGPTGRISYLGANQPLTPDNNPYRVFDRIFKNVEADPVQSTRIRDEGRSVLDYVVADLGRLQRRASAEDARRLDQHLTAVRAIEARLDQLAQASTCTPPAQGTPVESRAGNTPKLENVPRIVDLQLDLLVMALACNRTRVGSFMMGAAGGGYAQYAYTWLGSSEVQHLLSHTPNGSPGQADFVKGLVWETEQFAKLLDRMKNVAEPGGTLLDNALVMWGNELGVGNTHSGKDIPYVLAGRCGGRLRTGRYLRFDGGPSHSELYVPLLNALDIPAKTFGDPDFCTRPLPGVFS